MIQRYKENQQKYEAIVDYIENHSNITENLKKDILYVVEKYRSIVFVSEKQEIIDLIDVCIREGSKRKLQRSLHSVIFGNSRDKDIADVRADYER